MLKAFTEDYALMVALLIVCCIYVPIVRLFVKLYIAIKILELLVLALKGFCLFVYDVAKTLLSKKG